MNLASIHLPSVFLDWKSADTDSAKHLHTHASFKHVLTSDLSQWNRRTCIKANHMLKCFAESWSYLLQDIYWRKNGLLSSFYWMVKGEWLLKNSFLLISKNKRWVSLRKAREHLALSNELMGMYIQWKEKENQRH